ncbi:hypothetical protein HMPREF1142_0020 [Peptostreptococcaceae bacterium AS15]|nr:hypothetical protein HMPREF1142_0020 [Peptostreptococcaceae bacterium AS15]
MKINVQNKEMTRKKHKGFLLFMVIIITIIMLSVILAVTLLARAHSNDIINDTQRSKAYYIANAGAEMTYAALVEDVTGGNVLGRGGVAGGGFDKPKDNIMTKSNVQIKNKAGQVLGYVDLSLDLRKLSVPVAGGGTDTRWYFRILSKGKLDKNDNPDKPKDTHYVTMFIFCDDPTAGKLYDGDVQNP